MMRYHESKIFTMSLISYFCSYRIALILFDAIGGAFCETGRAQNKMKNLLYKPFFSRLNFGTCLTVDVFSTLFTSKDTIPKRN